MSWGTDGPFSLPNGTTWDDTTAPAGTWTSTGTGLTYSAGSYDFIFYRSEVEGSSPGTWSTYTDITSAISVLRFQCSRSVKSWWQGVKPNTATLEVDYTDMDGSTLDDYLQLTNRIQINVDGPYGEKNLWQGFIIDRYKTFNAAGYPVMRVQMVDQVGWAAQSTVPSYSGAAAQTADIVKGLLQSYMAGYKLADVSALPTASGVSQITTRSANNLIAEINDYIRGELALYWIDAAGQWRAKMRGWWTTQPDPVATIGSLDRPGSASRPDPTWDTGWKFPASLTQWNAPIGYTQIEWTYGVGGASTSTVSRPTSGAGLRKWHDDTRIAGAADADAGTVYLGAALYNMPQYAYMAGSDTQGRVEFQVDDLNAMGYACDADIGDFVEVAKETQLRFDRDWTPAWVMGVHHTFTPDTGWQCALDLEVGLAVYDDFEE